jgi:hypothetical protein
MRLYPCYIPKEGGVGDSEIGKEHNSAFSAFLLHKKARERIQALFRSEAEVKQIIHDTNLTGREGNSSAGPSSAIAAGPADTLTAGKGPSSGLDIKQGREGKLTLTYSAVAAYSKMCATAHNFAVMKSRCAYAVLLLYCHKGTMQEDAKHHC